MDVSTKTTFSATFPSTIDMLTATYYVSASKRKPAVHIKLMLFL
jgi:hypothetical protein